MAEDSGTEPPPSTPEVIPELPPPSGLAGLIVKLKRRLKARAEAKKKAAASHQKEVLWTDRLGDRWKDAVEAMGNLVGSFASPDPMTRRAALFMGICVLGIFSIGVYSVRRITLLKDLSKRMSIGSDEQAKNLGEFFAKQSNMNAARLATVAMGGFVVELKEIPGAQKVPGYMNMAELEIIVECDTRSTAVFIQDHLPQARDQMTGIFTATDRDQYLSAEGKKRIRRALVERLNHWLPKGKVKELYFNKLLIS